MSEQNLFYYPCASFTNAQLPLLNVAALWFDKLCSLIRSGQFQSPSAPITSPVMR